METITIYRFKKNRVYDCDVQMVVADPNKSPIPADHTRKSPHPIPYGHYAVMQGGWKYVEGDAPVYPDPVALASEQTASIRSERDSLLTASDWTQVIDAPVNQAAWAAYRQALRDMPQQEGFPLNIDWPTQPE
jgi:hypothetical protein